MANFIQTPELSKTLKPTTAGEIIRADQYGIDATLDNYIIQNVSISKSRVTDDTYDQKNALVSQLDVDERWDGQMTVIGGDGDENADLAGLEVGDMTFSWNDQLWKITGVSYNGVYNDKKSYTVTFFRTTNFPTAAQANS